MLECIDHCTSIQAHLRDSFGLTSFREPRGLLIIGRAAELEQDPIKGRLREQWNRLSGGK